MATSEQIPSDLTLEIGDDLSPERFIAAARAFFGTIETTSDWRTGLCSRMAATTLTAPMPNPITAATSTTAKSTGRPEDILAAIALAGTAIRSSDRGRPAISGCNLRMR
jgi:hypothetical protein